MARRYRSRGSSRPDRSPAIEGIIQQIFAGFFANSAIPGSQHPFSWSGMLHSNPGDYAWGQSGLDAIVTQLLGQLENTGPPPADKEKISSLPTVTVTQEQVDTGLECPVCKEDYAVAEQVRQLPCNHFFHSSCILPCLEQGPFEGLRTRPSLRGPSRKGGKNGKTLPVRGFLSAKGAREQEGLFHKEKSPPAGGGWCSSPNVDTGCPDPSELRIQERIPMDTGCPDPSSLWIQERIQRGCIPMDTGCLDPSLLRIQECIQRGCIPMDMGCPDPSSLWIQERVQRGCIPMDIGCPDPSLLHF
ncbi:PREDICTED: E3 ubiquitin-protein ligase RNF115 [Tinamus guttatus]|uniref:E3 ubiquitin-protein ligase RNF115 n=1 Tax=Tinamus guttatus TaxID=94827 RepID=UPI00052F1CC3|nr:PREDICTED: E3 ubiquitin-protein ligase RNF115 [Tinamus guttatus]